MIETLSFLLSFIVIIEDSGVTILSALIGDLLSDEEDEPIHICIDYKLIKSKKVEKSETLERDLIEKL